MGTQAKQSPRGRAALSLPLPVSLPLLLALALTLQLQPGAVTATPHPYPPSVRQDDEALTSFPPCPVKLPVVPDPQRIVGGRAPSGYLRSHMVSFRSAGCGGTLLSAEWVLTAAHCLLSLDSEAYIGGSNFTNGFATTVDAIFKHPDYDFPKNDIAVVHLSDSAPDTMRFVRVNADADAPAVGEFARVVGYGFRVESFDVELRGLLHQVDVPVIAHAQCKAAYTRFNSRLAPGITRDIHVCAGYETGGCDACIADSGGPLFVYDADARLVQVGVVSFGYGCGRRNMAGGYARVQPYLQWMRDVGATFETASSHRGVFRPGFEAPAASNAPAPPDSAPKPSTGPVPQEPPSATPDDDGGGGGGAFDSPWPSGAAPTASEEGLEPYASGEAADDGGEAVSGTGVGGTSGGTRVGGAGGMSAAAVGSAVGACVVVVVVVVATVVFRRRGASNRASSMATGTTPRMSMT